MKRSKILTSLIIIISIFIYGNSFAATYYVSPTGTATWANATNIVTPCSLSAANTNAVAGDTVILRGGTYNTGIAPSKSGANASSRITYQAYTAETPIISGRDTIGILIFEHKNYIKVDGIKVVSPIARHLLISVGSCYNEISNCTFSGVPSTDSPKIWSYTTPGSDGSTNNWIHHNTFYGMSVVTTSCNDAGFGLQVGVPTYDSVSGHNTIENNIFYHNGHHNLETFTKYNVIRNNFFHNEASVSVASDCPNYAREDSMYGNRNIQIYDGYGSDGTFNLIEGNRFGKTGPPPDDDGGDGLTITAPKNIVRYNDVFNSQNNGVLFKMGYNSRSDNNRFFNNSVYKSGRYDNGQWQGYDLRFYSSTQPAVGNVIKNNIFYEGSSGNIMHTTKPGYNTATDNTLTNNWLTSNGNPLFTNTTLSNPFSTMQPNLTLQPSSPAINAATHLTQASGSGTGATSLLVNDALYFQDGKWGSALAGHQADWIAIGTVTNIVQIRSINYFTNTITLSSPMSWSAGAKIWLYKKSDGKQVLYGSAPDMGAHEYSGDVAASATPLPPSNLRLMR